MSVQPLLAILIYVFTLLVIVVVAMRAAGDADGGAGRGGGGGVPREPKRPPGTPGADEPPWWPEFEREFAEYVADACARSRDPAPAAAATVCESVHRRAAGGPGADRTEPWL